jgi:hypothetical protein
VTSLPQAFTSSNRSSTPWLSTESEGRPLHSLREDPITQQPSLPQHASQLSNVPEVEDTDIEEHDEIDDEAVEPRAASDAQQSLASVDVFPPESPRQHLDDQPDPVPPTQLVAADNMAENDDAAAGAAATPAPPHSLGSGQRKGLARAAPVATPGPTTDPVQARKRLKPLALNRGATAAVSTVQEPSPPAARPAEAEAAAETPEAAADSGQPEMNADDKEEPPAPVPERKRLKKLASAFKVSEAANGAHTSRLYLTVITVKRRARVIY